ncbi:gastrula zinc finger protein XlCGF7.1-like [Rana temporaria]|uniref:gastrula zinc finger protein XlCGF7.1-like n=1 Tax=Rana temporaria TaxID=8407 RepID=UPI001AAD2E27|nr:gastrula zinc finger protein XlCGF7.1-like [Rana temporaria]
MEEEEKKMTHNKTEIKREPYVMGDDVPPGISTDPGDTRYTQRDVKAEEEEEEVIRVRIKEEEVPIEISTDPGAAQRDVKVEKEEEGRENLQRKDVLEIGIDGQYRTSDGQPSSKKPFMCLECGKFFARKYSLTVHQRLHTGEKPFACSDCGKRFSDKSNLNEHKRAHSPQESFTCSKCGRQCHTWRILVTHQRVHSGGEKTIECTKCGQTFSRRQHFKRHERRGCNMG